MQVSNKWQRLIWMREFLFEFFSPAEVKFMNFQSYFSFDLFFKNETKNKYLNFVIVVQSLSHAWLFATPWAEACQVSLALALVSLKIVLHYLPKLAQTHVHWINNALQPPHPLSSPAPPTFRLSQHQGLFQGVGFSHQVAKVLELQLQHQSFQ